MRDVYKRQKQERLDSSRNKILREANEQEMCIRDRDILATMMEMTEAIEGISRAVEESANGVTDAATNIDFLVQSMSTVNGQMEENSTVAKNLKEESAAFACV